MIIRLVKMTFRPESISDFESLFADRKDRIRSFEGCLHLELLQDAARPQIFFTYSHWQSESHLDKYRYSSFFRETWLKTKSLFAEKAEAWSLQSGNSPS